MAATARATHAAAHRASAGIGPWSDHEQDTPQTGRHGEPERGHGQDVTCGRPRPPNDQPDRPDEGGSERASQRQPGARQLPRPDGPSAGLDEQRVAPRAVDAVGVEECVVCARATDCDDGRRPVDGGKTDTRPAPSVHAQGGGDEMEEQRQQERPEDETAERSHQRVGTASAKRSGPNQQMPAATARVPTRRRGPSNHDSVPATQQDLPRKQIEQGRKCSGLPERQRSRRCRAP